MVLRPYFEFLILCLAGLTALGLIQSQRPPDLRVFTKACERQSGSRQLCQDIARRFFNSSAPVQALSLKSFEVAPLAIDAKVRYILLADPVQFAQFGYCYFVQKKWFDPKKVPPAMLNRIASGFAILASELPEYQEWLKTKAGANCRESYATQTGRKLHNLSKELQGQLSLIAINPLGALGKGSLPAIVDDARLTLRHERIHAIHVSCPAFAEFAEQHWQSLSQEQKTKLAKAYDFYDWSNPEVAVKEAIAFALEGDHESLKQRANLCSWPN